MKVIEHDLKSYYRSVWFFGLVLVTWCKKFPQELRVSWRPD